MARQRLPGSSVVLDYASIGSRNRDVTLLYLGEHVREFAKCQASGLSTLANLIGSRENEVVQMFGALFYGLYHRHATAGFHLLSTWQCFFAWYTLRPGLEALLFLGKVAEDDRNAEVWRGPRGKEYASIFSVKNLASHVFPGSEDLRDVVGELNSRYMHPNQQFVARSFAGQEVKAAQVSPEGGVDMTISLFDTNPTFEANLIAYVALTALVVDSVTAFVAALRPEFESAAPRAAAYRERFAAVAAALASTSEENRAVLERLGRWDFASS